MNNIIADILQDAWQRQALYGLFVHFQECYRDETPFTKAALLVKGLRAQDVPIIHAIKGDFSLETIRRRRALRTRHLGKDIRPVIRPIETGRAKDRETVIVSDEPNAFAFQKPPKRLMIQQNPVVVGAGVTAYDCFPETLGGLFRHVRDCTVIAASDGTNEVLDIDDYGAFLREKTGARRDQMYLSETPQILSAIDLARNPV